MAVRRVFAASGCRWIGAGAIIGALGLVMLLAAARVAGLETPATQPGATVQVLSYSTSTPVQPMGPISSATSPAAEAPSGSDSTAIPFDVGDYVEVYGTGGDGLRLRSGPSLDASINAMGMENEVFEVRDGPSQADAYTWWYLVNPYDESKQGWGVAAYLRRLQGQ